MNTESTNTLLSLATIEPGTPPHFDDFDDDELQPAIEELQPLCEKERQRTLQWHYKLGQAIYKHYLAVQKERERYSQTMYGEHFLNRVAESIADMTGRLLRDCLKLACTYTEATFGDLCTHPAITLTHALQLACVDDPAFRAELQAKIISERWTVSDLRAAIVEKYGGRRKPGAGRPLKVPKNVNAALTHLTAQIAKFVRMNEQIWFGGQFDLVDELLDGPVTRLDKNLKSQLQEAAELCDEMAQVASDDAERLREAIREVEGYLTGGTEVVECSAAG